MTVNTQEVVMVDEFPFPSQITTTKPLSFWSQDAEMAQKIFDQSIAVDVVIYSSMISGLTKEIKDSHYSMQLESAVRFRLAADDKYEEDEEEALEKIVDFFRSHYFKKESLITFNFPAATSNTAEIVVTIEGKEEPWKITVANANIVEMIKKWYLGGSRGVSPKTISSLAAAFSAQLST